MDVLDAKVPREKRGAEDLCFHYICYISAQRQSWPHHQLDAILPLPPKVLTVKEIGGNGER